MKSVKSLKKTNSNVKVEQKSQNDSSSDQEQIASSSAIQAQKIESQYSPVDSSQIQSQIQSSQTQSPHLIDMVSNQLVFDQQIGYLKGNYQMQKILKRRYNLQRKQFEYLIKWRNYPISQCTWQSTFDMIGQHSIKIKELGSKNLLAGKALLAAFEKSRGQTSIYDQQNDKIINKYIHSQKNHLKYAPEWLIDEMEQQYEQCYGQKSEYIKSSNKQEEGQIKSESAKLEFGNETSSIKISSKSELNIEQINSGKYYRFKNYFIEKILYFPFEFQIKILIHDFENEQNKQLLKCEDIMRIHPETGIFCYKAQLSMIQEWKKNNLPMH